MDFLIVRDRQPWVLVEVKTGDRRLSPVLVHFQRQLNAPHAFQVDFSLPFVADPVELREPVVVPARTFPSQLP